MKNLTNVFMESAPARFKLSFGVNDNVILKSISNEIKRDKNGVRINKICYMTFAKVDVDNDRKSLAETTFSYFVIDKATYAQKGLSHQILQLIEVAKAVAPADKVGEVISNINAVLVKDASVFEKVAKAVSAPDPKLTKEITRVQTALSEAFAEAIEPYLNENSELVQLLVVTGSNGQFLDLPREDKGFIAKMTDSRKLTIDSKYVRWYAEKDKKKTDVADDIGGDEIIDETEVLIEDDQDLDGI